ncbi:MAG: sulfatase [Polyangiaceae bacterium]|nr:sulfatase [Polyangiaceae bacterium]
MLKIDAQNAGFAHDAPEQDVAKASASASSASVRVQANAEAQASTMGGVRAVMFATFVFIVVNTATIALTLPLPVQGIRLRALHHLYDVGQHLAAGLLAAATVALWQKFGPRRSMWNHVALVVVSMGLAIPILRPDLHAFAHRTASLRWAGALLALLTTLGALGVVIAAEAGRRLGQTSRHLAWLGIGIGTIIFILNHRLLRRDYPGVHFFVALSGASLMAAAVASLRLPSWWARAVRAMPWILVTIIAGFTVVVWPGNVLLIEMLKVDGAVVAPWVARMYSARRGSASVPVAARAWYSDRSTLPPIPPTAPPLLGDKPVVVLISIDALRADIIQSKKYDARFPTFAKLRDQSIDFTMARANGTQTVYSLTTLFTGTYFSQQYWAIHPKVPATFPHEEPATRFPQFLADRGITTVSVTTSYLFNHAYGLLGGFSEEIQTEDKNITGRDPYARGVLMMNDIIKRLEKQGSEGLFLYSHLLDAHAPYDRAGTRGSEFDRYLAEVAYLDREIARLLTTLDKTGLASRCALIVTSDHGEAFGEHGSRTHGVSLYEELLRIPLFVRLPNVPPRKVDTPVTLIDLGPTILDLMGAPTPGSNMGQSLVPFLRGQSPVLNRPIVAETRLKKSLVTNDGFKIIVDDVSHTTEVYNLKTDPRELNNLYDGPGSPDAQRVELLRLFFDTHRIRRPGYVIPYRP